MVRLFQLLDKADQRVSTLQATSAHFGLSPKAAAIDKLTFDLGTTFSAADIKNRLRMAALAFKVTKLRDRRWYIQVGAETTGTYFALGSRIAPYAFRLVSRPSAFASFLEHQNHLSQFFSKQEINDLRVTRLDLALDYPQNLQSLLNGLDYEHKQNRTNYQDKSGRRTGMNIGSGSEKVVVYDKALESKLQTPITRIEIQLSGKKLPTRSLKGIEHALQQTSWNPFNSISLSHVTMTDQLESLSKPQATRLQRLSAIIDREGLFSARRTLNEQGNFARDYGPLHSVQPWTNQPADSFKKLIIDYFKPNQKER